MLLMITMVRIYNYDQLHLATIFFLLHQIVLVSNGALALTKGVPEPNCAVMEDRQSDGCRGEGDRENILSVADKIVGDTSLEDPKVELNIPRTQESKLAIGTWKRGPHPRRRGNGQLACSEGHCRSSPPW